MLPIGRPSFTTPVAASVYLHAPLPSPESVMEGAGMPLSSSQSVSRVTVNLPLLNIDSTPHPGGGSLQQNVFRIS